MATAKVQTGIRFTETMYGKLRTLAKNDGRSLNNLVEQVLRRYLEDYERQHGEIPVAD